MPINHCTLGGNLTRDPEVRTFGERAVANFTIAHNVRYRTNDGEDREEVSFIDCAAWGKTGEMVARFLTKGSPILVEGRLKQERWTDKEGQQRSRIALQVERVHLMRQADGTSRITDRGPEDGDGVGPSMVSPDSGAGASGPVREANPGRRAVSQTSPERHMPGGRGSIGDGRSINPERIGTDPPF